MHSNFLPIQLNGLRVVVTAGGSGIGKSIAQAFSEAGAEVLICDISESLVAQTHSYNPKLTSLVTDVSNPIDVEHLFDVVKKKWDGLDVLVNNAGIAGPTALVENIEYQDLEDTLKVNVSSQFYCAKHAVPLIKKSGGGSIINLSSVAGRHGFAFRSPYAAAKWGVIGFSKSLAIELGESNIRVNAILPGHVNSERFRRVVKAKSEAIGLDFETTKKQYLDLVSLKRNVEEHDIANMALFLASTFGANITGQAISVCGDVQMMPS